MRILKTPDELRALRRNADKNEFTIGFAPTMGFLHEGHLALVRRAVDECDIAVTSIFVNPAQFGKGEDFGSYPRDMDRDLRLLESAGCRTVFCPEVDVVYPEGFCTAVIVEGLSDKLCGAYRPGHFRGVATVVAKLLLMLLPDRAYFGEKDAQQLIIIRRMAGDLNIPCEIIGVPTVREPDGLAMSSRNIYLTFEERNAATALYRALCTAKNLVASGEDNAERVLAAAREVIETEPLLKIQYLEAVNRENLEPLEKLEGKVLIALAAYCGRARLIDNIMIDLEA